MLSKEFSHRMIRSTLVPLLSITSASFAFSPTLEWSWTSSAIEPNALNVMGTPSVIDLNEDGVPDVVFSSTASRWGRSRDWLFTCTQR